MTDENADKRKNKPPNGKPQEKKQPGRGGRGGKGGKR